MTPPAPRRSPRGPLALLTAAALGLALLLCGYGTWSYADARGDDSLDHAEQRDAALAEGRAALTTLTSLDARTSKSTEAGLRAWRSASTGALRDELARARPESGTRTRGTVTDAAVTALDTRAGTAKLLATVRVDVTRASGTAPGSDRKRLEAVLTRTGDGWRIKALGAVPVSGPEES
ncbi:hypothetical protein HUT18_07365 [Streptomyces sp. NA04227]|uniref:hypothetical protein n=1 Tax=Streptomyces sp. NA04227 TaxID=2742136 RepID=UPI0015928218|nr:hypothetical protein [Streptomyces sp. NA04227]QKW06247.1 hypothetical protein HUT18_07365 [Streptomyces sp. NA04227]